MCPRDLGPMTGADGEYRLAPSVVLLPDVAFISWARLPDRRLPSVPIWEVVPDLVVEVVSPSNIAAEMAFKRSVAVYTRAAVADRIVTRSDTLDGGDVLPGFAL